MPQFVTDDWLGAFRRSRTAWFKRAAYRVMLKWASSYYERHLSSDTISSFRPWRTIGPRGMPIEARRRWALAGLDIRNTTILVQGTGTGWDVLTWAGFRPARIIATDLFDFSKSWGEIRAYCASRYGVDVEFRQAPLEDHSFLADHSIDLCVSDAVFEHCRNMDAVLDESHRLIRAGGRLYAAYGPMWYCAGGDHFSGRGGLRNAFNHVLLTGVEYQDYFKKNLLEQENFQSGGRYVELDLFSKLTTKGYFDLYAAKGFSSDSLILEVSPDAVSFSREYPDIFQELVERGRGAYSRDDLLIKANLVLLGKN